MSAVECSRKGICQLLDLDDKWVRAKRSDSTLLEIEHLGIWHRDQDFDVFEKYAVRRTCDSSYRTMKKCVIHFDQHSTQPGRQKTWSPTQRSLEPRIRDIEGWHWGLHLRFRMLSRKPSKRHMKFSLMSFRRTWDSELACNRTSRTRHFVM